MTITNLTVRNDYVGNGSVNTYSYTFKIFEEDQLSVTVVDTSGTEYTLALTTDYTVTGVGETNGGTIVLVNSGQAWLTGGNLTSGWGITIIRDIPLTQETDIRNQGAFFPELHEDQFDRQVMQMQQLEEDFGRNITLPVSEAATDAATILPTAAARADKYFYWDINGDIAPRDTAYGNLASAYIIVGDASGIGQEVPMTGDIGISNTGVTSIQPGVIVDADINAGAAIAYSKLALTNSIVNADIASAAAIAFSKMATLTGSRALQTSAGGVIEVSGVTTTELGYVSGATSNLQAQLDAVATVNLLQPTEQASPNNTVLVSAGHFINSAGTARVYFAGGSSPVFGPVSANSRIDLLTIDDSGTLGITAGGEAVSPTVPVYPSDKQVIAHVLVNETGTVVINTADITDARGYLNLGGGSGTTFQRDEYIAGTASGTYTGSLTVVDLSFTYVNDGKSLNVYRGGVLAKPSASDPNGYVETDANTITFNNPLTTGEHITATTVTGTAPISGSNEYRENYTVGTPSGNYTGSLTVFDLVGSYSVTGKNLVVTYEGVTLTPGVDYTETDPNTVTMIITLTSGKLISFRWAIAQGLYDAPTVDGFSASATPTASTLLALNSSAQFPTIAMPSDMLTYRRPTLGWTSITEATMEWNYSISGTLYCRVIFPDGEMRYIDNTDLNLRRFNITETASFVGAGNSGLRSSLSETANTWYAIFAVKIVSSTKFALAGDTTHPTLGSWSTLDTRYGANNWVHIGYVRNGFNIFGGAGQDNDLLRFFQHNDWFIFPYGVGSNIPMGTSLARATTGNLVYAASYGSGAAQLPSTIGMAKWGIHVAGTGGGANMNIESQSFGGNSHYYEWIGKSSTETVTVEVVGPAVYGVQVTNSVTQAMDINLAGFQDTALGSGVAANF